MAMAQAGGNNNNLFIVLTLILFLTLIFRAKMAFFLAKIKKTDEMSSMKYLGLDRVMKYFTNSLSRNISWNIYLMCLRCGISATFACCCWLDGTCCVIDRRTPVNQAAIMYQSVSNHVSISQQSCVNRWAMMCKSISNCVPIGRQSCVNQSVNNHASISQQSCVNQSAVMCQPVSNDV